MTVLIQDTFTGADGNLTSHAPDVGGAWALSAGSASSLRLVSNTLRMPSATAGTLACYCTTAIAETTDLYLEFDVKFTSNASYCEVGFARNGASFSNSDKLLTIEFTSDSSNNLVGIDFDTTSSTGIVALNTSYTVRIEFANVAGNTIQTIYVGGVLKLTASLASATPDWFAGPLAVFIQDASGIQNAIVDNIEFGTFGAPPTPPASDFWTAFVGSHEVP